MLSKLSSSSFFVKQKKKKGFIHENECCKKYKVLYAILCLVSLPYKFDYYYM